MAQPRMVYFVGETMFVEGRGYRAVVVVEGEGGCHPTGDDDWETNPRAHMPYFWGPTLKDAEAQANEQNRRMGISPDEALMIVARSMGIGMAKRAKRSGK
jgi:hypothetical protein